MLAAVLPRGGVYISGSMRPGGVAQSNTTNVGFRLVAVIRVSRQLTLTLEATGTQHTPRSGNLMLLVRVGRPVLRSTHGCEILYMGHPKRSATSNTTMEVFPAAILTLDSV
jgi:hypothetical protein